MNDLISREAAIAYSISGMTREIDGDKWIRVSEVRESIKTMPSAEPDNQTNLCDSCDYSYPDCPSEKNDVIFGNDMGNDNICACNKYKPSARTESQKATWALHTYMPHNYYCTHCKNDSPYNKTWSYCPNCGFEMEGYV